MKKLLVLAACFMVLGLAGCKKRDTGAGTVASGEKKKTFIVGLDDSFPPMGFRNDDNQIVGFDIDLAAEAASRMGMELVLQPIDWGSKELELENDKVDCIWNGLSVDPARAEAMQLSRPYLANRMIIIVKADSGITSKDMLKDKKVGVQTGSTALQALENDAISAEVVKSDYENNVLALADLKIGRIDAVVMDEVVARYQTSKDGELYRILDAPLSTEVYAVGFKKGNKELCEKVEAVLDEMAADGVSDNISKKWFGEVIILK